MHTSYLPKFFLNSSTAAMLLMTGAHVAYADATAPCNAGTDPTALECGVNASAIGVDAMAVGTDAVANGNSTTAVGGESAATGLPPVVIVMV